jgi:hypothetical protein
MQQLLQLAAQVVQGLANAHHIADFYALLLHRGASFSLIRYACEFQSSPRGWSAAYTGAAGCLACRVEELLGDATRSGLIRNETLGCRPTLQIERR